MQTLLTLYTGSGILLCLLSLPLIAKKVRPNPIYGFRVKKTLQNPELWYSTNAHFAKRQLLVGLVVIAAALGFYFWPGISLDGYALACLAVFVVTFGLAIAQGVRHLRKQGDGERP